MKKLLSSSIVVFLTGSGFAQADAPDIYSPHPSEVQAAITQTATCMVASDPSKAVRIMESVPGSPDEERMVQNILEQLGDSCFVGDVSVWLTPTALRGAFAEQLFNSRYPASRDGTGEAPKASEFGPLSEAVDVSSALSAGYKLGRCTVMADLDGVRALVRAPAGSPAEAAKFKALQPALSNCVQKGATVSTDRYSLRVLLAEAVYQYSNAHSSSQSSEANH